MKKILTMLLTCLLVISIAGCGGSSKTPDEVKNALLTDIDTTTDNLQYKSDVVKDTVGASYDAYNENKDSINDFYKELNKDSKTLYTNIYNYTYEYCEALVASEDTSTDEGIENIKKSIEDFESDVDDELMDFYHDASDCCDNVHDAADGVCWDAYIDDKIGSDEWSDIDDKLYDTYDTEDDKIYDAYEKASDKLSEDVEKFEDGIDDGNFEVSELLDERDLSTTAEIKSKVKKDENSSDSSNSKSDGNGELTEESLYGTWKLTKVEVNGSEYTIDELKSMGEDVDGYENGYFVFKKGGNAYISEDGDSTVAEWRITNGKVRLGKADLVYENGNLVIEGNGNKLIIEKQSDSQDISKISNDDDK